MVSVAKSYFLLGLIVLWYSLLDCTNNRISGIFSMKRDPRFVEVEPNVLISTYYYHFSKIIKSVNIKTEMLLGKFLSTHLPVSEQRERKLPGHWKR